MINRLPSSLSGGNCRAISRKTCVWMLTFGLLSGLATGAQGASPTEQNADWEQRLAKAAELRREGEARQTAADKAYEAQGPACYKKFLVNRCLDNAFRELTEASREAKRLENEGKAIERQVKKEQLSVRDLEAAARAPERAAKLEVLKAETAAARNEAELEEATTRAEKARKAEEGARRKAEEAERLRIKQAEHEARVAEKMEKSAAKANANTNTNSDGGAVAKP
jgi:colicin import membrane protein